LGNVPRGNLWDYNYYTFTGSAGSQISVNLVRTATALGWENPESLDPRLDIVAPDGYIYASLMAGSPDGAQENTKSNGPSRDGSPSRESPVIPSGAGSASPASLSHWLTFASTCSGRRSTPSRRADHASESLSAITANGSILRKQIRCFFFIHVEYEGRNVRALHDVSAMMAVDQDELPFIVLKSQHGVTESDLLENDLERRLFGFWMTPSDLRVGKKFVRQDAAELADSVLGHGGSKRVCQFHNLSLQFKSWSRSTKPSGLRTSRNTGLISPDVRRSGTARP
jgi:hypothetical protein